MAHNGDLNGTQREAEADEATRVGDWSGRLPRESGATRRHRRVQGEWRTETLGWPAGPPLTKKTRETYPTLPNYIPEVWGDETAQGSGVNLMSDAAREYAEKRLPQIEAIDGAAEPGRLYRNLLSSQPLAFSIAGELRARPHAAVAVLRQLTGLAVTGLEELSGSSSVVPEEQKGQPRYRPLEAYTLGGIEAEWFPPRWAHTDDKSGFDIAACLGLEGGRRALVSIEVKYTDSFSAKKVTWAQYGKQLAAIGLIKSAAEELVEAGCSQVLRQVMITDSVRRVGLAPGVGDSGRVDEVLAVVLAREDDEAARQVAEAVDAATEVPVLFWTHADLLDAAAGQPPLAAWARDMAERYLPQL